MIAAILAISLLLLDTRRLARKERLARRDATILGKQYRVNHYGVRHAIEP